MAGWPFFRLFGCSPHRRGVPSFHALPGYLSLFDFRYYIAYIVPVTEANGAPGKIIYLGACLIAAVRLAREDKWDNSPRVAARIGDAINLARRIYDRMKSDFPHM
jgi:hypothetical protein